MTKIYTVLITKMVQMEKNIEAKSSNEAINIVKMSDDYSVGDKITVISVKEKSYCHECKSEVRIVCKDDDTGFIYTCDCGICSGDAPTPEGFGY